MRITILAATLLAASCATAPVAPVTHDHWNEGVTYAPIGNARDVAASFIMGAGNAPGLYTIRVRIREGGLMPPHSHPDTRQITVLSGDLYYGFGETADPAAAKRYPAGSFFIVPANQPHFAVGIGGDAVYQESGMAPTGTSWVTN
jgi:quercetin dioxygenase-like cupin family protein